MFLFIVRGRIYPLYFGFLLDKEGWIHSELSHCFSFVFYFVALYVVRLYIEKALDLSALSPYPSLFTTTSMNFLRKGTEGFMS